MLLVVAGLGVLPLLPPIASNGYALFHEWRSVGEVPMGRPLLAVSLYALWLLVFRSNAGGRKTV